ncbi:MAG: hypothetical protein IJH25_11430, partial [Clostridia bacterium]|nr:hypothetical protein [Clostridia bacterium]
LCYTASSPPGVATSSLRFATLGGKYPRPDFHRLDVRHARLTNEPAGICCRRELIVAIDFFYLKLAVPEYQGRLHFP